MRALAFIASALFAAATPVMAAQEVKVDGVTVSLPDGYGVVMAEPGGDAIPLDGIQAELDAARERDRASSYLIRDKAAAKSASETDTVIRISDHTDGPVAAGRVLEDAHPALDSDFKDNVAPWAASSTEGMRTYWVRTSNKRVPLVRVGCGVDSKRGCYLTAHLNGRLDLTMMSKEITDGPNLAASVDATLNRILP